MANNFWTKSKSSNKTIKGLQQVAQHIYYATRKSSIDRIMADISRQRIAVGESAEIYGYTVYYGEPVESTIQKKEPKHVYTEKNDFTWGTEYIYPSGYKIKKFIATGKLSVYNNAGKCISKNLSKDDFGRARLLLPEYSH